MRFDFSLKSRKIEIHVIIHKISFVVEIIRIVDYTFNSNVNHSIFITSVLLFQGLVKLSETFQMCLTFKEMTKMS